MISIIMTIYNGERYLKESITNILKTKEDIELILVNDGSTDRSYEICESFQMSDNRVKVIHKENGGIAESRNCGLRVATGEYVCFHDQDDYVTEDCYKTLLYDLETKDVDMVISNPGSIIKEKKLKNNSIFESKIESDIGKLCLEVIAGDTFVDEKENGLIWTSIWNCIFKKDIIDKFGIKFHSFINAEDDTIFLINYLVYCHKVYLEKENLYYWREHLSSESHTKRYIEDFDAKNTCFWNFILELLKKKLTEGQLEQVNIYLNYRKTINYFLNECYGEPVIRAIRNIKEIKEKYLDRETKEYIHNSYLYTRMKPEHKIIYDNLLTNTAFAVIKFKLWLLKDKLMRKTVKKSMQK